MASKKDKLLENAQRFLLKGQLDKAIREYQQVVALEPKETRYRQKLAELLVRDNRKLEAIAEYEDIGKHYADNSYFLKAIAVYKQIQRLSPDDTAISLTLAELNHKQGLTGNALAEYGQVVARMEQEGRLKEALKVVDEMLKVDAAHAATRLKQAELLHAVDDPEGSYQAFKGLLSVLRAAGDDAGVNRITDRMLQLFPEQVEADLDPIADAISSGGIEQAVKVLKGRLQRDRNNLQAWQLLCDAERRRGDRAALKDACRQMLSIFPENAAVVEAAVRSEMEDADFQGALSILEHHLHPLLDNDGALVAEQLFLALPKDPAYDARVLEGLMHVYKAAGEWDKLNAVHAASRQPAAGASTASGEGAADLTEHPAAPSAFTEPAPSLASFPAAAAGAPDMDLPLSWEEEIELDLDDGLPDLDFSLPGPEAAAGAVSSPSVAQEDSLPGWSDLSPFGDLPEVALDLPSEPAEESDRSPFADPFASDSGEAPVFELDLDEEGPELELSLPEHDDLFGAAPAPKGTEAAPAPFEVPEAFEAPEAEAFELPEAFEAPEAEAFELPEAFEAPEAEAFELPEAFEAPEAEAFELPEAFEAPEAFELPEAFEVPGVPELPEVLELPEVEAVEEAPAEVDWDSIYPEAVAASAAGIDIADLESHYDLGIGYKEMGMYNAAIKEFDVAAANPQRRLDCLTLQSICYLEKGEPAQAEELLQRGRELTVLAPEERIAVSYHLGVVLEATGAADGAIALYREVSRVNPHFHDVAQRLARLSGEEEPLDVIDLELEEN